MGKPLLSVFIMAVITAALSFTASFCDVRSGANRGWVYTGDAVYYYDDFGEEYSGFKVMPDDGTTRYFDEETHIMVTGETEISGNRYLFDADGVMLTGFRETGGVTRYYSPETGIMKLGWFNDKTDLYYYDETTGGMATSWEEIEGKRV